MAASVLGPDLAVDNNSCIKPKFMFVGLRKAGKSSIRSMLFHKMCPYQIAYRGNTVSVKREDATPTCFLPLDIWEVTTPIELMDSFYSGPMVVHGCCTVVLVVDVQYERSEQLEDLIEVVAKAYRANLLSHFVVFIHKVDELGKADCEQMHHNLSGLVSEVFELFGLTNVSVSFYMTSIFDYTVYEAVSQVVQRINPRIGFMENLLNVLSASCGMMAAQLIDAATKICVATDSNQTDGELILLCGDTMQTAMDLTGLYSSDSRDILLDDKFCSDVFLNNNTVLLLRQVTPYLLLVAVIRVQSYNKYAGIMEYNFQCFRRSFREAFPGRLQADVFTTPVRSSAKMTRFRLEQQFPIAPFSESSLGAEGSYSQSDVQPSVDAMPTDVKPAIGGSSNRDTSQYPSGSVHYQNVARKNVHW